MQQKQQKARVSILGSGWLGLACAQLLLAAGYTIKGSSRNPETRNRLREMGAEAFALDLPGSLEEANDFFQACDVLIITLPPGGRQHGQEASEKYLDKLSALLPWLGEASAPKVIYTSSTGVYGASTGPVDEETPLSPTTNSGLAVAAAEEFLRRNVPNLTILRLAGLVGPGRHPGRFYGGRDRVIPQADAPVNLVHQEDVIRAIQLVIGQNLWEKTLNVCAADHPRKGGFYRAAAEALGLSIAGVTAGGEESKVIRSEKIRQLGWLPKYDTAAGLLGF